MTNGVGWQNILRRRVIKLRRNNAEFTPLEITFRGSTDVGLRFRIIPARFSLFKNKFLTGFTLIELLVSVSIIALLSGLLLVNYHSTNKRSELVNAAQALASDIRLTQSYALSLKEFNGAPPPGGWGIYFNNSQPSNYIIFADNNSDSDYTGGEEFKTVNLPAGVTISFIILDSQNNNFANIVFTPPDPAIYINGDITSNAANAKITLKENQDNTIKTIEVNSLGLVDVVD